MRPSRSSSARRRNYALVSFEFQMKSAGAGNDAKFEATHTVFEGQEPNPLMLRQPTCSMARRKRDFEATEDVLTTEDLSTEPGALNEIIRHGAALEVTVVLQPSLSTGAGAEQQDDSLHMLPSFSPKSSFKQLCLRAVGLLQQPS